jgi:hypothetical protein
MAKRRERPLDVALAAANRLQAGVGAGDPSLLVAVQRGVSRRKHFLASEAF